jgi:hypothetical protein
MFRKFEAMEGMDTPPPSDADVVHPLEDEDEDKVPAEVRMLARMTLSDNNISPKPFSGTSHDAEKADQWLASFQTYAKLRALPKSAQVQYFHLLMADDAALWLRSLPSETANDMKLLIAEFSKRYSLTAIDRWRKASSLWSRVQGADESVDKYISDIRNAARVVPITDAATLQFAVIRGLRPEIRLHVLQTSPTTLEDVIKAARVAETAIMASQPNAEVLLLRQQVATLIGKLEEKPAVAAVTPVEQPRRVTFEGTADSAPQQRQPAWNRSSSLDRQTVRETPRRQEDEYNNRRPWSNQERQSDARDRYQSPRENDWQSSSRGPPRPGARQQDDRGQRQPRQRSYTSYTRDGNGPNYSNYTCFTCGRMGHISRNCWENTRRVPPNPNFRR